MLPINGATIRRVYGVAYGVAIRTFSLRRASLTGRATGRVVTGAADVSAIFNVVCVLLKKYDDLSCGRLCVSRVVARGIVSVLICLFGAIAAQRQSGAAELLMFQGWSKLFWPN